MTGRPTVSVMPQSCWSGAPKRWCHSMYCAALRFWAKVTLRRRWARAVAPRRFNRLTRQLVLVDRITLRQWHAGLAEYDASLADRLGRLSRDVQARRLGEDHHALRMVDEIAQLVGGAGGVRRHRDRA